MHKRVLILGIALVLAGSVAVAGMVATSGASFAGASSSTASASTAGVSDLLHLYSQTSDPDGLTGYYTRAGITPATLSASGVDETLTVDLGKEPTGNTTEARVFTIKAAYPLPTGITSITVAISDTDDPSNVVNSMGFADVGKTGRTASVTLAAGQKMQCNLRTKVPNPRGTVYTLTLVIKVTYSGYTGTMFTYNVPLTVTAS